MAAISITSIVIGLDTAAGRDGVYSTVITAMNDDSQWVGQKLQVIK